MSKFFPQRHQGVVYAKSAAGETPSSLSAIIGMRRSRHLPRAGACNWGKVIGRLGAAKLILARPSTEMMADTPKGIYACTEA
jgi:hypothetical protein